MLCLSFAAGTAPLSLKPGWSPGQVALLTLSGLGHGMFKTTGIGGAADLWLAIDAAWLKVERAPISKHGCLRRIAMHGTPRSGDIESIRLWKSV